MVRLKNCLMWASLFLMISFLHVTVVHAKDSEHKLAKGDNPKLDEVLIRANTKDSDSTAVKGWASYSKLMEGLVREYFPKAKIKLSSMRLQVEFRIRSYDIPSINKIEQGPDWGGILFDMDLKDGQYSGVYTVPKKFNQYSYYHVMLYAPYSIKLNKHLETRIAYPFDVPPDFLKRFISLVENFDQHF